METNMTQTKTRVGKWKAGLAALALGALLVIPAGAQEQHDQAEVNFTLEGGDFAASITDASMTDATFAATDMSTTGEVGISVEDLRGGDGNWTVSLQADPFEQTEGTGLIDAENLSAEAGSDEDGTGLNGDANVSYSAAENLSSESEIASGTNAHGTVSWTNALNLNIPEATQAGEYSSTLTLTSNVAPSGEGS
jgi:hypothetical protein